MTSSARRAISDHGIVSGFGLMKFSSSQMRLAHAGGVSP